MLLQISKEAPRDRGYPCRTLTFNYRRGPLASPFTRAFVTCQKMVLYKCPQSHTREILAYCCVIFLTVDGSYTIKGLFNISIEIRLLDLFCSKRRQQVNRVSIRMGIFHQLSGFNQVLGLDLILCYFLNFEFPEAIG